MNSWCIYYVGRVDKCVQNFGVSPLKKSVISKFKNKLEDDIKMDLRRKVLWG